MNICIFEDFLISKLAPLNYLRHTSKLICGAWTLQEKILNYFPAKIKLTLHSRKYISAYCRDKFPNAQVNELREGEYIFLNSRVLFNKSNLKDIVKQFKKEKNSALLQGKNIIAFHTSADKTGKLREVINPETDNLITPSDIEWLSLNKIEANDFKVINYPGDLILYNEAEIIYDLKHLSKTKLHVSKKAKLSKQVSFDTSRGNIYIDKNVTIEPYTYIQGPVYIGEGSLLRSGTKLYGPARIGDMCKVSGEITNSILHRYVNKQHLGFLGHSYLCEWVNLGAGTTTSNLKNNYSNIVLNINGEEVNTNSIFLGSIIGDHTKTGIQTMLNTGTLVGISSNLYGAGFHKNIIKSFSWTDAAAGENKIYEPDKALNTAKISMSRRGAEMTKTYEDMFMHVFNNKDELFI
jgi:UDP-N-acetylglucosamine diphosphorylase/glucosamine-1-phosphate N-acetyltransferase